MIITFFISAIAVKSKNLKVWTNIYEIGVYNQFQEISKSQINDSYTRDKFCQCCVNKLKIILPNGLESVSDRQLKEITVKIATDCKTEVLGEFVFSKWTADTEQKLKSFFLILIKICRYLKTLGMSTVIVW